MKKLSSFLEKMKCEDFFYKKITSLDYPFADVFIITCLSARHVNACCGDVEKFIKENKELFYQGKIKSNISGAKSNSIISVDNSSDDGWAIVEIKSTKTAIHFFTKQSREHYKLEQHIANM